MALTDSQYRAWLKSASARRCVLVEATARVAGVETVRYLSTAPYTTGGSDVPANTGYQAVLSGGLAITEKLSIDGSAALTAGDIEIGNHDGSRDAWLLDVWENRPVNIFLGDVAWPRADFRQVFAGTQGQLLCRDRTTLNLSLRDKLQRLNTPVTDSRLGGSTENKDRVRPTLLGECFNIEPLLINPATLQYQVHDGAIERIIEVCDNGNPVNFTPDLATGTFALAVKPIGVITCTPQGDKAGGVYRNTIGALIERLVTGYGKPADRFTSGDLDASSFAAFESAHPQPVGLYLPERTNVLQACADLASSVGAQLVMSATGQLRLLKVALSGLGTLTAVGRSQMSPDSLHIADRPQVAAACKVGYCRNWCVQTNLQSGIPEQHKNLYAAEWLTTTATNAAVATDYRLATEPVQIDTLLLTEADAAAEAARRLALWEAQRTVFGYLGLPELMLESLGGGQTLTHGRFGLAAGRTGQIVGMTRSLMTCRVQLEVLA